MPAPDHDRIVITGVGLTAPNGNSLSEYRAALLAGRSGVVPFETRYMPPVLAGVCDFDPLRHQNRREVRRGTRAGSVAVYCAHEALGDSGLPWDEVNKERVGVYLGITEHGNVETENEIFEISQFDHDTKVWSHHHNPRTVANNPAGEVTLSLKITGPHLTLGAACAAGNAGLIQGCQMLRLGEVDYALCGGVSESIHTFGIFASFAAQGALACCDAGSPAEACRPFDLNRRGIVVAEGGGVVTLERLDAAKRRGAKVYGEIVGHAMNSDASDFVLPSRTGQARCLEMGLERAGLGPGEIDVLSSHATATVQGDIEEATAIHSVFGDASTPPAVNNTKSFIGHAMGAAGVLELLGNLPGFGDGVVHPTINCPDPDPRCPVPNLVANEPRRVGRVDHVLNNSFGMLGINSVVIVKRPPGGRRLGVGVLQLIFCKREAMTRPEIRGVILDILENIAPDEDLSDLNDGDPFREQMELDSMDFLDIVMELRKRYRVQIPEEDYPHLNTMDGTVNYLEPKLADTPV